MHVQFEYINLFLVSESSMMNDCLDLGDVNQGKSAFSRIYYIHM
jgi:hypothetical protein